MTKKAGPPAQRGINTMRESSLHAAVKQWYAQPGDELEVTVDGFTIDLVRKGGPEGVLEGTARIEVATR